MPEEVQDRAGRMEATALRILSHRSHTRAELRKKLGGRGYARGEIDPLLERLAGLGYLDDAAAVRSRIRHRLQSRPMGRRLLARELREVGVDAALLTDALERAYGEGGERELAREAASKKVRSLREPHRRDRLLRFLQGRGFPASICIEVAREILPGNSEGEGP